MYMSYCRFEGTAQELTACLAEVNEHLWEESPYKVSEREIGCFRNMVQTFHEFLMSAEMLTEDGELDEGRLDEVCDYMRRACEGEED